MVLFEGEIMKSYLFILHLTLLSLSAYNAQAIQPQFFGKKPQLKVAISLDEAQKNFDKYKNKTILVEGKVVKVCQKKGCWITLKGKQSETMVRFHDYSFFVPKNLQNIKVKVEGKLSLTTMKISEQKHYLEDEGAPQKKIDAIKKDKETWLFMATGVIASS